MALLAATMLTLTACGDQTDPPKDLGAAMGDPAIPPYNPDEPLDDDQLAEVLVNASDVGPEFKERTQKSPENDSFGCLARIDDIDDFGTPDNYREIVFNGSSKTQQYTSIFASVASFDQSDTTDESDNDAALLTWGKIDQHMKACTKVRTRDKHGRVQVDLTYDDSLDVSADGQSSLTGKGFYTYDGKRYPQVATYTVVWAGNEIITIAAFGERPDVLSRIQPLAKASVERLNALESAAQ
ncbi:hypothetical protein ASD66_15710 [Nocardioides sp. Root151]|nr:hypothetical protein ASD30_13260 [Nocardioides sp. Root140]KQZ68720.1 hypothetical protein ASD66_15710 [Nocardioides sp. Root151]KRF11848.1 hypothetical protein ASH02_17930 [Nocardioides sp. Soil796]